MIISAIILAHNVERSKNLGEIVDSLYMGTAQPKNVVVFIDNPYIHFQDSRVKIIESTHSYPVITRFALGLCETADRILMIDDDLKLGKKTLMSFVEHAIYYQHALLGLEGNILAKDGDQIYTNGQSVDRGNKFTDVDILIRTYFATPEHLLNAFAIREMYKDRLPEKSIDDVLLCMANKYHRKGRNIVIPVDKDSDVIELGDKGVGQCTDPEHYTNRNYTCDLLRI